MDNPPHKISPPSPQPLQATPLAATPSLRTWNEPQTPGWLWQAPPIPVSNMPLARSW